MLILGASESFLTALQPLRRIIRRDQECKALGGVLTPAQFGIESENHASMKHQTWVGVQ
jgi:hypothetical protein